MELLLLIKSQLEVTDIHFRPLHEDNRSLPYDADLKSYFKILNMGVSIL